MLPVCPRTSTATAVVLFIVAIAWDGARGAAESTRVARAPLPPDLPVREVALGERYRAGSFHTFFLGDEYRALWTAPIQVPVLDLRRVAGGLEVERASGGKETRAGRIERRSCDVYVVPVLQRIQERGKCDCFRTRGAVRIGPGNAKQFQLFFFDARRKRLGETALIVRPKTVPFDKSVRLAHHRVRTG